MKHKHLYSLLDNSYALARVVFNTAPPPPEPPRAPGQSRKGPAPWDGPQTPPMPSYQYKVPKAWNVKAEDFLVVSGHQGLTVVRVLEVDDTASIDPDASHDYKWAIQRVDFSEFDQLTAKERLFQEAMLGVERVRQKEQLMSSFRDQLPDGSEARALFEASVQQIAGKPVDPEAE